MSRIMLISLITLMSIGSASSQGAPVPVRKVPTQLYLVNQNATPLLVAKFGTVPDCEAAITNSGGKSLSSGGVNVSLVCVATTR